MKSTNPHLLMEDPYNVQLFFLAKYTVIKSKAILVTGCGGL
jgi:hypothetical protein